MAIRVNFYQNELMVEIYSKSLVRSIGKVRNLARTLIKTHKVAFVCKQTAVLVVPAITLGNNMEICFVNILHIWKIFMNKFI